MTFFDFELVTDPPNDEFVNEATQLNANLDKLDTRLGQFQSDDPFTAITSPPVGTEALDVVTNNVVRVWTGTLWGGPVSISSNWTVWSDIPLLAPVVERPGFTPKARANTAIRKVQLAGGLRADILAGPWPSAKTQISANAGGIHDDYKPVVDHVVLYTAASASTVAGEFIGAKVIIEHNAGNSVKISVEQQGNDGGGNFVVLDGIEWWY